VRLKRDLEKELKAILKSDINRALDNSLSVVWRTTLNRFLVRERIYGMAKNGYHSQAVVFSNSPV